MKCSRAKKNDDNANISDHELQKFKIIISIGIAHSMGVKNDQKTCY